MSKYLIAAVIFWTTLAVFAGQGIVTDISAYKSFRCEAMDATKKISFEGEMITLSIDEHFGRFQQVQFDLDGHSLQYQLLIEETPEIKKNGTVLVLQNLKVDDQETSVEITSANITEVHAQNGSYQVKCQINPVP